MTQRRNFVPVAFVPRQNPFYVALPYNDVTRGTTKPEAKVLIPWFRQAFVQEGHTVCKDRWIAVARGNRVAYAQWEDCGPFRTDHYQYVFGAETTPAQPEPGRGSGRFAGRPRLRRHVERHGCLFVAVRGRERGAVRSVAALR